jgi:hypothetical protein
MKFATGLFLGLGIASAAAQYPVVVDRFTGVATLKVDKVNKIFATLDAEEIAKIREACK